MRMPQRQNQVRRKIKEKGFLTLREDGIRKVEEGITSLEEVIKLTSEE